MTIRLRTRELATLAAVTMFLAPQLAAAQDPKPQPSKTQPPGAQRPTTQAPANAPEPAAEAAPAPEPPPVAQAAEGEKRAPELNHVLAVDGEMVVLDVSEATGAKVGNVVELWRPLRLRHPVSGELIEDTVLIGKMRLSQVRAKLSLAKPIGELVEPLVAGDVVILGDDEGAAAYRHDELQQPEPSPAVSARSMDAAAVDAMMITLRGASLRKRVATYDAFLRKYPDSAYAATLC
jgi:hypothetical protein